MLGGGFAPLPGPETTLPIEPAASAEPLITRANHEAKVPPSTARTWPVTMLDASEAK
jgi:hypothetical protein